MLSRIVAAITIAAMACSPCNEGYEHTTQGVSIWPHGEKLEVYECSPPTHAQAEVGLALEAVLFAFDHLAILEYSNCMLEDLHLVDKRIFVCFVEGNALGDAGLMQLKGIWVSLGDADGQPLPIEQTALVHELVHEITWRACILPDCEPDSGHTDNRLWGSAGVEGLAQAIVSAFRP